MSRSKWPKDDDDTNQQILKIESNFFAQTIDDPGKLKPDRKIDGRETDETLTDLICRICLFDSNNFLRIFDVKGKQLNIAQVIEQHLPFKPTPNDTISSVVCQSCWLTVNEFHEFYKTVEKAHKQFQEQHEFDKINAEFVNSANLLNLDVQIKTENENCDTNKSVNDTGDDEEQLQHIAKNDLLNNPLYEAEMCEISLEGNSDIKAESEKPLADADDEDADNLSDNSDYVNEDDDKSWSGENSPVIVEKSKRLKTKRKHSNAEIKVKRTKKRQKIMKDSPKDDEVIKKHIAMGCDLCPFVGGNFTDITDHFRGQHLKLRPYVKCCGRKLGKRSLLIQHAYKHEDPEFFKCNDCSKVFSDGYGLRTHVMNNHGPEEELAYACDQCPKRFSRLSFLNLHKPSHIPQNERQFKCEQCPQSKSFASLHLLRIHISMRHNKSTNVCHVCAKEIRDKNAFEKHVRLHFEDSGPRVKCPRADCDRWLKDVDNLKQHMRRHNEEGKVWKCNVCDKMCKNRRSLISHRNYAHTDEVFECEACHKTFKKAITLKEHMAQHTGQALYKCPFCTRTFNSNANMHSHKKKMHPVEWDNWRKTKTGSSQSIIKTLGQ